jgi:hypothetical protein
MSNELHGWEDFSFKQASALAAGVKADDPRSRLQTLYLEIERADLVIGLWNEPDKDGLFWAPIKGDPYMAYAEGKIGQTLPATSFAAIPCRNFKEMVSFRVLFGDERLGADENVPPLRKGPYNAVDVRDVFAFDPVH